MPGLRLSARRLAVLAVGIALILPPGPVRAQEATTTTAPATTLLPRPTTTAPTTAPTTTAPVTSTTGAATTSGPAPTAVPTTRASTTTETPSTEPVTTTTTAPPGAPPTAPTTTADVAVGERIAQDTPDLTVVVWLFVLAVLATAGMLLAGYLKTRG